MIKYSMRFVNVSKKHNSVKCNYKIYNKEFMIIVCTFEKWWSELEDFIYSVEMIMNHKNLEYFMLIKQLSHHQARWSEFLSRFNYHIAYHFNKIDDKLNALTCCSENLSKEKNTFNSCYDSSYASTLIAMLMTIVDRSSLGYRVVSRSTLFRISLCFSESYK